MGVGGQHHAPAVLPPEKTRYPLYRRLGRHQGRSGEGRKISPPPGFDPRTVQPAASRYTDWAIPARFALRDVKLVLLRDKIVVYHVNQTQLLHRQAIFSGFLEVKAGGVLRHRFQFERFNKAPRPQNTGVVLSIQLLHTTELDITFRPDSVELDYNSRQHWMTSTQR